MSANRSTAVMQQRRSDDAPRRGRQVAPRQLNYFPTPPWATRALGIQQGEAWRRVIAIGIEGLAELEGEQR